MIMRTRGKSGLCNQSEFETILVTGPCLTGSDRFVPMLRSVSVSEVGRGPKRSCRAQDAKLAHNVQGGWRRPRPWKGNLEAKISAIT